MKKYAKRLLPLLLALCLLLTAAVLYSSAAEIVDSGTCGDNLTWTLDSDGLLTISGTGNMSNYSIGSEYDSIYRLYKDYTTAPWGGSFEKGNQVKSVVIKSGVTSIGYSAFRGCMKLTSVTIGNSVTSIMDYAFMSCKGLASVTIGNSVTSIGKFAFAGCSVLKSVTIPNSVTNIGRHAFCNCTGLTSVTISNSVTIIEACSFDGCTGLVSVTIPNHVTSIGDAAFAHCTGLTSVTIPNSVTSIGYGAFEGCKGLTNVTIPDSITSIGDSAFFNTAWYNTQPDGLVYAGKVAYKYKGKMPEKTAINIKDRTLSISNRAFSGCTGLASVTIPDSVTNIGVYAFRGCTGLTSVTIPDSVTSIGNSAFHACTGLKSVTIPNSVTSIGNSAFSYCTGLSSVTIPNSVTSIGSSAFSGCTELTSVTIPNSVTSIGEYAFSGCSGLKNVYFKGNKSDWRKIAIKDYNTPLTSANIHYYYSAVTYNANGGTGTPAEQTKIQGEALKLSDVKPEKSFELTYNANGGNVSVSSKNVSATFHNWNTKKDGSGTSYAPGGTYTLDADTTLYAQWTNPKAGDLAVPTRENYAFAGWFTAAAGGTQITEDSTVTKSQTLYAHWTKLEGYKVIYNANGGKDAPDPQFKTKGLDLTLSSKMPSKTCKISYVPNGGKLSETGKEVSAVFDVWNTAADGTGVSYAAGSFYVIDKNLTLYAQWRNPKAGELAVPTREGYTFVGWFTAVSGGKQVNKDTEIKADTILYAVWAAFLPGDVSGDGEVTAEDARLALRAAVGLETYAAGSTQFLAADATKDGAITAEDARLILRAAVGLETLA